MRPDVHGTVSVLAPGRLHLGFLDPAASLGRRFGSVGLVIDGYQTVVALGRAMSDEVVTACVDAAAELGRAEACLRTLRQLTGCHAPVRLQLLEVLPPHTGLGSGTQLALAVGRAFANLHGLDMDSPTLARGLGRGLRSGIGIAGFDQGGLLVDGGPGPDGAPAPLLARMDLPAAWRVVVVQDPQHRGLSGPLERQALASLPPLPQAAAAEICHQVLMRVLPGAAGGEFQLFAAGVTRMQQVLGEHFAPAQGGTGFTSPAVGRLMAWLADGHAGAAAIGQSSWGPTAFAITASPAEAEALVSAARAAGMIGPGLTVRTVAARNRGAAVTSHAAAAPQTADAAPQPL
jgi:beta-ribofuranosylaminobenzene 5'-phosphate synthase